MAISNLGSNSVSQLARKFAKRGPGVFPDIATFVTSPTGLAQSIFPSQRFFLKVFEKENLDDTVADIEIRDQFNEKVLYRLTERGYYQHLRDDGRFSLDYEVYQNCYVVELVLMMGRRASKSTMIGMWIATKIAQLLMHDEPQKYFGIVSSDFMNISLTALGEDSATKLFAKLASLIQAGPYFKPFILEPPTTTSMRIWTRHDLDAMRDKKAKSGEALTNSLNITAQANSAGVRGDNNIFAVLEEFAHFNVTKGAAKGEKQLDERIHEALAPSVSGFRSPDGLPYGKVLIITSPNGAQGKAFLEYDNAFKLGADSYTLAMSAPTWEVNPLVGSAFLRKEYNSSTSTYEQEYGAKIVEGGLSWLRDLPLFYLAARKGHAAEPPHGLVNRTYYAGIDFALSNDSTAVAICHFEPGFLENPEEYVPEAFSYNTGEEWINPPSRGVYVVDYVGERTAGTPPFQDRKTLLIDDVLDWIDHLFRLWPIAGGIYDQWSGELIRQLIESRGWSRKLTMLNMTEGANDSIAKLFSELLNDRRMKLPDHPPLLKNLLRLQVEHRPRGLIRVEAPSGAHDDDFDAISRAIWLAHAAQTKNFHLAGVKIDIQLLPGVERSMDFSKVRSEAAYRKVQEAQHAGSQSMRSQSAMLQRAKIMGNGLRHR